MFISALSLREERMQRWIPAILLLTAMAPAWADDAADCVSPPTRPAAPGVRAAACQRLADQGQAWAQRTLGNLYNNGDGVPQSFAVSVGWLQRAAEQGDVDALV